MKLLLSELAGFINGQLHGVDSIIESISIDTRTLSANSVYIALSGQRFDGHDFITQAEQGGAVAVVVERLVETQLAQIVVNDTRLALAELAGAWRQRFPVKLIAVTGSNGKTTVKEMTAAILSVHDEVLFTQGNLNNEIGVPLTLLRLDEKHQYAVVEMGANHAGEIAYSCRYACPDIALLNNVGSAHLEGFGSIEGVARAKSEIFQGLADKGVAIVNRDDDFYAFCRSFAEDKKVMSFGLHPQADVKAESIQCSIVEHQFVTAFDLCWGSEKIAINLSLAGEHNVLNALAASAACLAAGISLLQIKQGLESVLPVKGRLQPMLTQQRALLIDDTYNANPDSLKVALDVLLHSGQESWVVLGAFAELGDVSINLHQKLGKLMQEKGIKRLFAIGDEAKAAVDSFGAEAVFFNDQQQLINDLKQQLTGNETLLIKGSRSQHMERVVTALVKDY